MAETQEGPLGHLTVLDLTHYVAGPYCTNLLAAQGAEVIKVERPGAGDPGRALGPFPDDIPHPEKSGLFLYLNQNKKSITLDLETETGGGILKRLVAQADLLVENFHPRVMPSLGLDYPTLEQINPHLVMTSISNFGHTGPYRDWKAPDMVLFAASGLMHMAGEPGQEPLRMAARLVQFIAGVYAFSATMTALVAREATGQGQQVDVSIMQALAASHENTFSYLFFTGEVHPRIGSFGPAWMLLPCKDGYVGVSAVAFRDANWQALCRLMGREDLIADPRFTTPGDRTANRDQVVAAVMEMVGDKNRDELYHQGQATHLPIGAVYSIDEVFRDPHLEARGFWQEVDHPAAGKLRYPGPAFRQTGWDWPFRPAPTLGQHNQEVYCGRLGYSGEELVRLYQNSVI